MKSMKLANKIWERVKKLQYSNYTESIYSIYINYPEYRQGQKRTYTSRFLATKAAVNSFLHHS